MKKILILSVILIFGILVRLPYINEPLLNDNEAEWWIVAENFVDGGVPYRDIMPIRLPGIIFIYAFIMKFFGKQMLYLRIFTIIFNLFTILVIYKFAKDVYNEKIGYLAALLFAFFSASYFPGDFIKADVEIFMMLPATLAMYMLYKRRYFFTGLFIGFALLLKLPNIFILFGILIYILFLKKKIRKIFSLFIGFIIAWLPVLFYFFINNALNDFFYVRYLSIVYAKSSLWILFFLKFMKGLKIIFFGNFLFWALFLAGLIFILINFKKKYKFNLLLLTWIFFSIIAICSGGRFFGSHFLHLIPVASIIAALALYKLLKSFKFDLKNIFLILIILFGFIAPLYHFQFQYIIDHYTFEKGFNGKTFFEPTYSVSNYIKKNTNINDKIFVWGESHSIYYYSNRKHAVKHYLLNFIGFTVSSKIGKPNQFMLNGLLNDLIRNKPVYIADMSYPTSYFKDFPLSKFSEIYKFIKENYKLETNIKGVDIYRLK